MHMTRSSSLHSRVSTYSVNSFSLAIIGLLILRFCGNFHNQGLAIIKAIPRNPSNNSSLSSSEDLKHNDYCIYIRTQQAINDVDSTPDSSRYVSLSFHSTYVPLRKSLLLDQLIGVFVAICTVGISEYFTTTALSKPLCPIT